MERRLGWEEQVGSSSAGPKVLGFLGESGGQLATHSSGNSVANCIFWVKEKLSHPALEQMAFIPASLEKL